MSARVGILGGTFDPPHQGHIALAKSAVRELKLDRLFVVPAKVSPLKSNPETSIKNRLELLRRAFAKINKCRISLIEMNRPGPSYTVESALKFRQRFPSDELFLILGSDSLKTFHQWKNWKKILKFCSLAVGRRQGLKEKFYKLKGPFNGKIFWLKSKMPEVSSTELRAQIQKGSFRIKSAPLSVLKYIKNRSLYARRRRRG